ncbi:23S rRNA pseudouridine1911/1915/1917 synthase [Syntrophus gentianae]|uniref:Pseudouridine synthase n=1 Tax=Syntrophus gentianae TaxID=43775 RepID=A0A1H7U766_9BACT|nr:RluA family pseudouridine synthase [Syntrophus gentianae]SEL92900.1 23S rRNA pseudouridine1911/1915/1917 synthase [Syntrophus gentianae]
MKTTINKSTTLIEFLTEQFPDSPRTRIKKLLQHGNIRCNNKTVTLHSYELAAGDVVEINTHGGTAAKAALPFPVLFEDQHIIVVEKPVGIVTSSTDGSMSVQGIISEFLKGQTKGKMRASVVHRLDKEVSGVLLLAKSHLAMNRIKEKWKETEKRYYALVEGKPEKSAGTIESWLVEDHSQKVHSTHESSKAKFSITHYRTIQQVNQYTLLDVNLETGRKNQIRVHLSDIRCPIVGDRKYGASAEYVRRIRLHAYYLSFPHPITGERITIESPMPKEFLSIKDRDEKYR